MSSAVVSVFGVVWMMLKGSADSIKVYEGFDCTIKTSLNQSKQHF